MFQKAAACRRESSHYFQGRARALSKRLTGSMHLLLRQLRIERLPEGTNAVSMEEGTSRKIFVFGELRRDQEVICTGPLRHKLSDAVEDFRSLKSVESQYGVDAACKHAEELDMQVMLSRFIHGGHNH